MNSSASSIMVTVVSGFLALLVFTLYKMNTRLDAITSSPVTTNTAKKNIKEHSANSHNAQAIAPVTSQSQIVDPNRHGVPGRNITRNVSKIIASDQISENSYTQNNLAQAEKTYQEDRGRKGRENEVYQNDRFNNDMYVKTSIGQRESNHIKPRSRNILRRERFKTREYKVKKNDNLSKIVLKTGVKKSRILQLNEKLKRNPDRLRIGQIITLPPF